MHLCGQKKNTQKHTHTHIHTKSSKFFLNRKHILGLNNTYQALLVLDVLKLVQTGMSDEVKQNFSDICSLLLMPAGLLSFLVYDHSLTGDTQFAIEHLVLLAVLGYMFAEIFHI